MNNDEKILKILPDINRLARFMSPDLFPIPLQYRNLCKIFQERENDFLRRERNIENASALFGIDRLQYEKMEDFLSSTPHCNMSVMDLIQFSCAGFTGALAGEKLRQSIVLPAVKEKYTSQSFVPLSPLSHKEFLIAQVIQSVLEFKQNTESEFKNDYQKRRRPHETVRARLRGWFATTISPSYRPS